VFVLVRPRAGDFVYSSAEHRTMVEQVGHARSAGADGIVTGALTAEGTIAESRLWELLGAAPGLPFTFHRAFDACRDPAASLETLMHLGVKRVLTSGGGGAATAAHGAGNIRALVDQASGRIGILAGGGVTPENVAQLVRATGVTEVHFSVREAEKVRRALAAVREL
jgi:copper homeostasis protein